MQDKEDGAYAQTRGNTTFESGTLAAQKGAGLPIEMFKDANGFPLQGPNGVTSSCERLNAEKLNA